MIKYFYVLCNGMTNHRDSILKLIQTLLGTVILLPIFTLYYRCHIHRIIFCGGINPYTLMAKLGPARIGGSGPPKDDVRPG